MAYSGTFTATFSQPVNGIVEEWTTIHDAATTTDDSGYIDMAGVESFHLDTEISASATVGVYATSMDSPVDATEYTQMGSNITATGFVSYEQKEIPRYVKVGIFSHGSGTVTVRMKRRRRVYR